METPDATTGWVRTSLALAVLAVLEEGDRHGYALAQRIAELGLGPVRGGALYPVLGRLETEGAVAADWQAGEGGPGRKVYRLTTEGRARRTVEVAGWESFSTALDALLTTTTTGTTTKGSR